MNLGPNYDGEFMFKVSCTYCAVILNVFVDYGLSFCSLPG